jgi:hypothetical protein
MREYGDASKNEGGSGEQSGAHDQTPTETWHPRA